jgi:tRNA pseudouridine55 synthase
MARSRALGDGTFDGVLVVDKPVGPTSHDMVDLVRRLTGVRRVGHGGTLDPFAGGVLPVFIGRATRLVEYHMTDDKAYRAMIAFGATSTTDDLDGELTAGDGPPPTRDEVEAALARFRGRISQVPPDHSAVRVQGRRAYELARGGERPALTAREVEVRRLDLMAWDDADPSRPTATVEIECSAGTYIRAIARDLGAALGCGAYLVALTRSRSGPFTRDQAHAPDAIRAAFAADAGAGLLLAADAGLDGFPTIELDGGDLQALLRGQVVRAPLDAARDGAATRPRGGRCRIHDAGGHLAAIARLEGGRLHPEKVLIEPEPRV